MSKFIKAKDSRGHKIPGLWQRNERFYAQFRVPGKKNPVMVPLIDPTGKPYATVPQARDAMNALKAKRDVNDLPPIEKTCTLGEYIDRYILWLDTNKPKDEKTIKKEKHTLALWKKRMGHFGLAFFGPAHIEQFVAKRRDDENNKTGEPVCNRTINLDIIALNNCLERAKNVDKLIQRLPTEHWKPLPYKSPKRPLWTDAQIDLVCQKAMEREAQKKVSEGRDGCGRMLVDYIRFLCETGSRRTAAFQMKWEDVEFDNRKVWFRRGVKYSDVYCLEMGPNLETLLRDMHARRQPDSEFVFPSPRSGKDEEGNRKDAPVFTLQNVFYDAREAAGFVDMRFHDFRHYFISKCVMRGIDYMTIAKWVNHKDGGILIGKVYGHLNDEHAKKQAAKLADVVPAPTATADPAALQALLQQTLAHLQNNKAA